MDQAGIERYSAVREHGCDELGGKQRRAWEPVRVWVERHVGLGQFLSDELASGYRFQRQLFGVCVGGERGMDPLRVDESRNLRGANDVEGADAYTDANRNADRNANRDTDDNADSYGDAYADSYRDAY